MNKLLILTLSLKEILTLVFVRWWVNSSIYSILLCEVVGGPNMGVSWAVATSGGSNPFKIHLHAHHQFQIFSISHSPPQSEMFNAPKKALFFSQIVHQSNPIQFPFVPKWLDTACNQTLAGRSQSQTVAEHFSPNLSPKNQQIKGRLACNQIWPFVVPARQTVSDCCGFGTLSKKSVLTSSKVWIWSEHLRDKCQSFSKLFLRTKRQFLHLDKRQRPGGISSGLFCAPLNQSRLQSGITKLLHMCTYSFACKNAQMDYTILKKANPPTTPLHHSHLSSPSHDTGMCNQHKCLQWYILLAWTGQRRDGQRLVTLVASYTH